MEALEHSCFFRRSIFCSIVFSNCFWNCITAISSRFAETTKIEKHGRLPTLSSLTRNYIAWSFLFVCDVINAFERKALALIVCSAQRNVSYMPSCGRTKLPLYHCIRWKDCLAQNLSWVTQIILLYFALHKSRTSLTLKAKVLTLHSLLFKWKGGVSCVTQLVECV